jgi:hypothetical protein
VYLAAQYEVQIKILINYKKVIMTKDNINNLKLALLLAVRQIAQSVENKSPNFYCACTTPINIKSFAITLENNLADNNANKILVYIKTFLENEALENFSAAVTQQLAANIKNIFPEESWNHVAESFKNTYRTYTSSYPLKFEVCPIDKCALELINDELNTNKIPPQEHQKYENELIKALNQQTECKTLPESEIPKLQCL